ncbi:7370_t:CDS:2 [Ambispora leptoticha]|uniref:ATP-dependent DNA helicase n=1 Tax=Ambispora leptoticha TaxID=144679 RepID=A0A9N9CRN9_9GLOM|nr:7370_t:CDS:2 [Ambispora leptoticha]
MKKNQIQNKDNYAPRLPEEQINKIVRELSDPNLSPSSQNIEDTEEELLLIKVLKRKLNEGSIKAEMTNDDGEANFKPPLKTHDGDKFRKERKNNQELFRASVEDKKDKELNQEQKQVEKLVLDGKSIFLTGSAGTGKSFLLRHLIKLLQKKHGVDKVGITSTTGTGALIIGGKTFHSYLGIGIVGHLDEETLHVGGKGFRQIGKYCSNNSQKQPNWPDDGIEPTILLSTKKEISAVNRREMKKLRGKNYTFLAKDQENVPGELNELIKDCLAHDELELKKVNGSQGVIVGFTNDPYPIVKFADGKELVVRERI